MHRPIHELTDAYRRGDLTPTAVAETYLARIDALDGRVGAYLTVVREQALAAARESELRWRAGAPLGPLDGAPVALKDVLCTVGVRTTCGSKMLESFVPPYDATTVERLRAAGAVILGKTNMDEFAMGSSTETSFYGPVKNPWGRAFVPGGSSGGSAAAVAARMAPAATGTDTGGSIRQPAALSGLSGLKPTYGLVSRYGMIAFASSLDQGGPIAKSAEDLALLLNVMAGFDARDSTSVERAREDYVRDLEKPLAGLRIGVPKEHFGEGLAADVGKAVEAALREFEKLGATRVPIGLPNSGHSVPAYYVIAPAEASSNLSRFDGVRYGHRAKEHRDLADMYRRTRAEGFGAEVRRRILIGTYVLSHGYYDAYYVKAQKIRRLIADDFAAAFKQCDVIVGPTAPTVAFKIGAKAADPVQMYLNDIYTIPVNLAGLPGMSIPCGFGKDDLPVGLHIVGNYFSEAKMLNVAHQYQRATDWHKREPTGIQR